VNGSGKAGEGSEGASTKTEALEGEGGPPVETRILAWARPEGRQRRKTRKAEATRGRPECRGADDQKDILE
jgi:hypothetical protein